MKNIKKLVSLIIVSLFVVGAFAQEISTDSKGVPEIAGTEVNAIMSTMKALSDDELKKIASKLCGDVYLSDTVGFSFKRFIKLIADGVGADPNAENINEVISTFLNTNKNKLICSEDKYKQDKREKHLYKQALLRGITDLYDDVLLDDELYEIDFNSYEIVNGKKETILDYIDKLIEGDSHDSDELRLIQMDIEELGGKRGADL